MADPRPLGQRGETLRAEAKRRGVTTWKIRNERRFLHQQFNGGPRDLVMAFRGEFTGDELVCPYCVRLLERRRYPSLFQSYLDCSLCCTTWSLGYEEEAMEESLMATTVHVVPRHDIVNHETTEGAECSCGPRTEPVTRQDGSVGWVVIHHSLDGREGWK